MPLFPPGWRYGTGVTLLVLAGCAVGAGNTAGPQDLPPPQRQAELIHFVRNDCGACHGMRLTGGLGPDITPPALPDRTVDSVSATILYGHSGTPMPGWRGLLSEADARWIAERLLAGFPEEP